MINKESITKGVKEFTKTAGNITKDVTKKTIDSTTKFAKKTIDSTAELTKKTINNTTEFTKKATIEAKDKIIEVKDEAIKMIDENGNGSIDIEDIIIMGLRVKGIRINRSEFLRAELYKNYDEKVIEDAIKHNPMHAGIKKEEIDKIADEVIKYERNCVSGISTLLGMPGGLAMAATIPTDIVQYYGYMLRATQKLMYLYGFPEINVDEKNNKFDSETINILTICLGVMYGVAGANNALKVLAKSLGTGVEKQLMNKALTKGTIYPIVRKVSKWFGKKMTKEVFAGFFKKAIPVMGGLVGGGITYVSFKPCCDRLKSSLQDTMLSNPKYKETEEELIEE